MNPELIYKYLENTATDAETEQVLDWLDADPAHMRELDELDKVMAASVIYGPDVLSPALARKAARRISLGRIPLRRIVRYAAELAAVAVVGVGLARMLADDRIGEWARRTTALEVPAGQYLSMELQDGTKVWLNAGTRLEYPLVFAGGERRVKVAGEAMFDVEHDPAHPFVVETFACDVEVLGTKFDVMAEEREGLFSAALLRGSVKVTNRLTPGEQFVLKPNEEVRLAGRRRLPLDRRDDQHQGPFVRGADAQIRKELRREDTDRPRPDAGGRLQPRQDPHFGRRRFGAAPVADGLGFHLYAQRRQRNDRHTITNL